MPELNADTCNRLLDNMPQIVMRLVYADPKWAVTYVNGAIERYGYVREDFTSGKMSWNDLLHPDDRVVAVKLARDYIVNNIDEFKLRYRIVAKSGASIYITEYSHVNRNPDGSQSSIDSYLFEDLESRAMQTPEGEAAIQRNLALNDVLLTLQDATSDPEKAIQFILDRVGALLDCSRALLFKDSPDHKTCKVVYEWLNKGITSIKELDYAVTYSTEMPEIYIALQDTGVLLVNAGEIPENCREEFEAEGLVSSAIFAVYQQGDHFGFVCFDDCIVERRWDPETANFLKVVANLLSNAVMHLQSARYVSEYEEKIRSLAFRDYLTGLPNHYHFDSDFADVIHAAGAAGKPGYAVMIGLRDSNAIRNSHGLKVTEDVVVTVGNAIREALDDALGGRGVLYRIAGSVFAVLAQPGPADPVLDFAERVARRGLEPWRAGDADYPCLLTVSAIPFGVKKTDPEAIMALLDAANVKSNASPDSPLVFLTEE